MAAADASGSLPGGWDPRELEQYRRYLLRYALLQLRDTSAAEDAVQETLLAAVQSGGQFAGRSSLKTWLTGILKHKIIDHVRRLNREQPMGHPGGETAEGDTEFIEQKFAEDGHWRNFPGHWQTPDSSFESRQFWATLERCMDAMSPRTARVFMMREVMDVPTEEICKELGISTTNCWVMLHRARLSLRECLETKWFATK
jgi:RNA polymerase sigma-70 factor, ECF subfamily